MKNPIILIYGGTGVGTSTYSLEFAKRLGISNIVSTDSIRQVIRSVIAGDINTTLGKSTYLAGQTANYSKKSIDVKKAEIKRAYKIQCAAISVGIYGVIKRAIIENAPLIVEGVHLIPSKFRNTDLYSQCKDKLLEILIYIDSEEVHKKRFISRQQNAPERSMNKYLNNFQEIRWIQDYIFEKADPFRNEMLFLENAGLLGENVERIISFYDSKL